MFIARGTLLFVDCAALLLLLGGTLLFLNGVANLITFWFAEAFPSSRTAADKLTIF